MKRNKEVLAITVIGALVVGLIIIIGLISVNLVSDIGLGDKVKDFFAGDKISNENNEKVDIEEIPYEEVFYYPFKGENELWGYVDENFNVVISPQFMGADVFTNGLGGVMTKNGYGYINREGKLVIEDKYSCIEPFSDGVALVSRDSISNENFIININGEVLGSVDSKYGCRPFENGTAIIYDDDDEGLINKKGDIILKINNEMISPSVDDIRLVKKSENKYFYVDINGEVLGDKSYYYALDFKHGYGMVEDKNYNTSIIDKNGKIVMGPSNFEIYDVTSEGIIVVDKDEFKYGLIGYTGEVLIKPTFNDIYEFNEGLAFARIDTNTISDRLCVINNKGDILFNLDEESRYYTETFKDGVSIIRDDKDNSGVINLKGEFVVPLLKAYIYQSGNFITVSEGEEYKYTKKRLYNLSGKLLYEGSNEVEFISANDNVMLVENYNEDSMIMVNKDGNQLKVY